jgi:flavodoxin
MNRLFIYYSLSGNGDLVAETLEKQGYALRRVTPKKKPPKRFFWQIMAGGFGAGIGRKEPLSDYDPDVKDFDEIAIGSPVWNARLSCPINTVLDKTDLSGKKLTFVLYSGSGEAPKAEKKIRELFPDAKIVRLKEPKKYPDELKKL